MSVERKSLADFVSTVIHNRARFYRELDRLRGYGDAAVVVEGPRGTPENRPMRDTSKPANGRDQNKGCYTSPAVRPAILFFCYGPIRPILAAPGRRIRLRRDATGAPLQVPAYHAGRRRRPGLSIGWPESAKSREREGSALAFKKLLSLLGSGGFQLTEAVLVRQLRGPHLSTWPWCSRRSSMELTAATSASSLPQSSTGRLEVSRVLARS